MQRTSATLRLSAQALILAFAALLLVAIGCTGAQASPIQASSTPAQAPASASTSTLAAPWPTGPSPTVAAAPVPDSPTAGDPAVLDKGSLDRDSLDKDSHDKGSLDKAVPNQAVLVLTAATSRLPACTPGRDTARMEKNAVAAPTALLQHSPAAAFSRNAAQAGWDADESLLSGRIPDALTHLDLGIVRT